MSGKHRHYFRESGDCRCGQPRPADGGYIMPRSCERTFTLTFDSAHGGLSIGSILSTAPVRETLAAAVTSQIEAMTADLGTAPAELPAGPRDLTSYRDAYASAAAKCNHEDAVELIFGRQWTCDDCGRTLDRADMRRAGWSRWSL